MQTMTIGLDLGKAVFHVVGVNADGKMSLRRKLRRNELVEFFARLAPCLVGMEACPSAHHWARELIKLGHTVKTMPPRYVKAYLKSNKNDFNDAEAICEAVTRPTMRFVVIKSVEQQAILHLHRARELYVRQRVALINHTHSMLAEYGVVFSRGAHKFIERASAALHAAEGVMAQPIADALKALIDHLRELDKQIAQLERSILIWHRDNELSQRLATIPGVGPITASALVGTIGNASMFKSRTRTCRVLRPCAPSALHWRSCNTTWHQQTRRSLLENPARARSASADLVDYARAALGAIQHTLVDYSVDGTHHLNKAVVAQAHKTARIAWAVLAKGEPYRSANAA